GHAQQVRRAPDRHADPVAPRGEHLDRLRVERPFRLTLPGREHPPHHLGTDPCVPYHLEAHVPSSPAAVPKARLRPPAAPLAPPPVARASIHLIGRAPHGRRDQVADQGFHACSPTSTATPCTTSATARDRPSCSSTASAAAPTSGT